MGGFPVQKVMVEATQGVPLSGEGVQEGGEVELMRGQGEVMVVGKVVCKEVEVSKKVVWGK